MGLMLQSDLRGLSLLFPPSSRWGRGVMQQPTTPMPLIEIRHGITGMLFVLCGKHSDRLAIPRHSGAPLTATSTVASVTPIVTSALAMVSKSAAASMMHHTRLESQQPGRGQHAGEP